MLVPPPYPHISFGALQLNLCYNITDVRHQLQRPTNLVWILTAGGFCLSWVSVVRFPNGALIKSRVTFERSGEGETKLTARDTSRRDKERIGRVCSFFQRSRYRSRSVDGAGVVVPLQVARTNILSPFSLPLRRPRQRRRRRRCLISCWHRVLWAQICSVWLWVEWIPRRPPPSS